MAGSNGFYEGLSAQDGGRKLYRGIPMLCEDGLHEHVADLAEQLLAPGARRVLDVGCGQGALSLRLHDRGFLVEACDVVDRFQCRDRIRFVNARAEDAAFNGPYDAVFLVEVLEHLESPFAVLRKYMELVKDGGHLVVTTPNVDSDLSRAWFLLKGRHWYFDERNVRDDGHITPVHDFQVRRFCEDAGLDIVRAHTTAENRSPAGAFRLLAGLARTLRRLRRVPARDGKIAVWVLRKPGPGDARARSERLGADGGRVLDPCAS